jgi:oligopeptide/dipeptide ABC transporter ATP-binding protein
MKLLEVQNLCVDFAIGKKTLHAVRNISFEMQEGEAVGIVGESGCGKSATAQAIAHLSKAKVSGKILFENQQNVGAGKKIGMIFQDPMSSLNPTMKIGSQITEGLIFHKMASRTEAKKKTIELLELVGISDPLIRMQQYPHHLSGGMRQRVLIAIALACRPKLLIGDEPTTALDKANKIQILDLIKKMQKHFQMSLLLISHDFDVIAKVCDQVLVMYAGKIVERGSLKSVMENPQHPYTQALLNCLPKNQIKGSPLQIIQGSPPNLFALPKGCAFKERCPFAHPKCEEEPQGSVACWRVL